MNGKLNSQKILSQLRLRIVDWDKLSNYIDIFSLERIVNDYSEPFVDENINKFYDFVDSEQLINLIEFDKNISIKILKGILLLENKLKNIIITQWKEHYQLTNTKIYNFTDESFQRLIPNIKRCNDLKFTKFRYSLFEYVSTSEPLESYSSLADIPIEELAYSWTLATTINFYRTIDTQIQKKILNEFNVPNNLNEIFDKMLSVILKVRNMISHNNVLYNFSSRLYRIEFNQIFSSIRRSSSSYDKNITLDKVCSIIDYLLNKSVCLENIGQELKSLQVNNYSKEYVIKLIYGLF